eukprot:6172438-Pleurochrysis_carterae.AAC.3
MRIARSHGQGGRSGSTLRETSYRRETPASVVDKLNETSIMEAYTQYENTMGTRYERTEGDVHPVERREIEQKPKPCACGNRMNPTRDIAQ